MVFYPRYGLILSYSEELICNIFGCPKLIPSLPFWCRKILQINSSECWTVLIHTLDKRPLHSLIKYRPRIFITIQKICGVVYHSTEWYGNLQLQIRKKMIWKIQYIKTFFSVGYGIKKCLTLKQCHATAEEDLENLAVIYWTQA